MALTFTPLDIIQNGTGKFHVNRFRVYFLPLESMTLAELADGFMGNFVRIFNGQKRLEVPTEPPQYAPVYDNIPPHQSLQSQDRTSPYPMRRNIAAVEAYEQDGKKLLKFTGDMRALKGALNLPDIHDDWVAESWHKNGVGLAMQTQRAERAVLDVGWSDLISTAFPPSSSLLYSPVGGLAEESFEQFNAAHFLAGRRSWILGEELASSAALRLATDQSHTIVVKPRRCWYLETAAVERYSSAFYTVAGSVESLTEYAMPGLRKSIKAVWVTQLRNFLSWYKIDSAMVELKPVIWPAGLSAHDSGVHYAMHSFDTVDELINTVWVHELLKIHPSLADQFE